MVGERRGWREKPLIKGQLIIQFYIKLLYGLRYGCVMGALWSVQTVLMYFCHINDSVICYLPLSWSRKMLMLLCYISVGMCPGRSSSITFEGSPESARATPYGFISLHFHKNTPASHISVSSSRSSRHVTSLLLSHTCTWKLDYWTVNSRPFTRNLSCSSFFLWVNLFIETKTRPEANTTDT